MGPSAGNLSPSVLEQLGSHCRIVSLSIGEMQTSPAVHEDLAFGICLEKSYLQSKQGSVSWDGSCHHSGEGTSIGLLDQHILWSSRGISWTPCCSCENVAAVTWPYVLARAICPTQQAQDVPPAVAVELLFMWYGWARDTSPFLRGMSKENLAVDGGGQLSPTSVTPSSSSVYWCITNWLGAHMEELAAAQEW